MHTRIIGPNTVAQLLDPDDKVRPKRAEGVTLPDAKPGNVRAVNSFLRRIGRRYHLIPLVHCQQPQCHTLISQRRKRHEWIDKRGKAQSKRLCNHHKKEVM